MSRSSKVGPMVPLERASKARRLPALDPNQARNDVLAKKYKAVVSGRPLPRRAPEPSFEQSKYSESDKNEE